MELAQALMRAHAAHDEARVKELLGRARRDVLAASTAYLVACVAALIERETTGDPETVARALLAGAEGVDADMAVVAAGLALAEAQQSMSKGAH